MSVPHITHRGLSCAADVLVCTARGGEGCILVTTCKELVGLSKEGRKDGMDRVWSVGVPPLLHPGSRRVCMYHCQGGQAGR